jgi:hypothetical protein
LRQEFLVVYEHGKRNYRGFPSDIPGCFSTSRVEVKLLFKVAAEAHLRELAICGDKFPAAETTEIPGLTAGVPSGAITLEWTDVEFPQPRKRNDDGGRP